MAYSTAEETAAKAAYRAAKHPFFVPCNVLATYDLIQWGTIAASNNDSSYPTSRCVDGLTNLWSQPADDDSTKIDLQFDLHSAPVNMDCMLIIYDLSGISAADFEGTTIRVYVADDSAFSSNELKVAQCPGDQLNLLASADEIPYLYFLIPDLQDINGDVYDALDRISLSDVPYLRIEHDTDSVDWFVRISEVWAGTKLYLPMPPAVPYGVVSAERSIERFSADGGTTVSYRRGEDRRMLDMVISMNETDESDETQKLLRTLEFRSSFGARPVLYAERPALFQSLSGAIEGHLSALMLLDPISIRSIGGCHHEARVHGIEQGGVTCLSSSPYLLIAHSVHQ